MAKLVITWWHNENICGVNHVTSGYPNIMWAYAIDLPGSLHTNKIPVILGRYSLLGFFAAQILFLLTGTMVNLTANKTLEIENHARLT